MRHILTGVDRKATSEAVVGDLGEGQGYEEKKEVVRGRNVSLDGVGRRRSRSFYVHRVWIWGGGFS